MGFSIATIDLYMFMKHIALHCIEVGQTMREKLSYHVNRDAEFSVYYNEVCRTTGNVL